MDPAQWVRAGIAALVALAAAAALVALRRRKAPSAAPGDAAMPLWSHVAELRRRLLASLAVFALAALATLTVHVELRGRVPVPRPALYDPLAAQAFHALAQRLVPEGVQLVVVRPAEALGAQVTVGLVLAAIVALPVLLWQLGAFVRPALTAAQARLVARSAVPVLALFAAGALFALLWVLPFMVEALYAFAGPLEAAPLLQVGELVSLAALMVFVFGVAFQTPLVMYVLARVGLVGPAGYRRVWRHVLVAIAFLSALLTPDPTPIGMMMVAIPMAGLFGIGVALAAVGERRANAA